MRGPTRWLSMTLVLVVVGGGGAWLFLSWNGALHLPESQIARRIEREIPVGTPWQSVEERISSLGFEVESASRERGYSWNLDEPGGSGFMVLYLGGYRILFVTDVEALLRFDSSGRLESIRVRKSTDAP